jgi:protein-tyrosine phosphatase
MERVATPNRLPPGLEPDLVPLVSEDPDDSPMKTLARAGADDFLRLLYLHILERSAPAVGRIIEGLACEDDLPAVFHCSAGKDRTGLITGVLMSVLGVPSEVIVDDYAMTGRYRTTEHVQQSVQRIGQAQKLPPEVVAGMLEAPRPAMELALKEIGDKYDGFDRYLTGPARAPAGLPERLRASLLSD